MAPPSAEINKNFLRAGQTGLIFKDRPIYRRTLLHRWYVHVNRNSAVAIPAARRKEGGMAVETFYDLSMKQSFTAKRAAKPREETCSRSSFQSSLLVSSERASILC